MLGLLFLLSTASRHRDFHIHILFRTCREAHVRAREVTHVSKYDTSEMAESEKLPHSNLV